MSKREKNTPEDKLDAPSVLPIPEGQEDSSPETGFPMEYPGLQEASDARDPGAVPPAVGKKIPEIPATDEQEFAAKEVLEGVDRADNDQRREGTHPSTQPPPSERE